MVQLIHATFKERTVPEEVAWATVVLISEGREGYQRIDLVEVVWKVCAAVVNCRLKRSVTLNDTLHGLRVDRVTGKTTLEAKCAVGRVGL